MKAGARHGRRPVGVLSATAVLTAMLAIAGVAA